MILDAMNAGKHVICEKPLTGYSGRPGEENVGINTSKKAMLEYVITQIDQLKEVAAHSKGKFMYAENFIYATPVQKAAEIIRTKRSKILWMKGEESVKGSTTAAAGLWKCIGGGSLTRVACHPLTGILWLKQQEALNRGEEIAEMLPTKIGWNKAFVSDEVIRGYMGELQDFMECITEDREPQSGLDIACDTIKVLYAAYQSAEEGRRGLYFA